MPRRRSGPKRLAATRAIRRVLPLPLSLHNPFLHVAQHPPHFPDLFHQPFTRPSELLQPSLPHPPGLLEELRRNLPLTHPPRPLHSPLAPDVQLPGSRSGKGVLRIPKA